MFYDVALRVDTNTRTSQLPNNKDRERRQTFVKASVAPNLCVRLLTHLLFHPQVDVGRLLAPTGATACAL